MEDRGTWVLTIAVGLIVGTAFASYSANEYGAACGGPLYFAMSILMWAGFIHGWRLMRSIENVIGVVLFLPVVGWIIYFLIKVLAAFAVGWIVMLVKLVMAVGDKLLTHRQLR